MITKTKRNPRRAGRPAVKDLREHKEAILEAATEVFLERGFEKANTAEIAKRAGASKGTLYSLYATKTELYAALMHRRVSNAVAPLNDALLESEKPVRETLLAFSLRLHQWVGSAEALRLYRLVVSAGESLPELGAALWESGPGRGRTVLKQYLDGKVRAGLLQIDDTDQAALQFLGSIIGMVAMRGSLSLAPLSSTRKEEASWVSNAVDVFLRAHHPQRVPQRTHTRAPAPRGC